MLGTSVDTSFYPGSNVSFSEESKPQKRDSMNTNIGPKTIHIEKSGMKLTVSPRKPLQISTQYVASENIWKG